MIDSNAVQHINIKVFAHEPADIQLTDVITVFHQYIRDSAFPEMLIDVADYSHVPEGPGILLIGHQANYSLDNRNGRLGLLYNRKVQVDGTLQDRLAQARQAALAACDLLEKEAVFGGDLKFDRDSLEVSVNDRLLAPNTDETWQTLRPQLENFFPGFTLKRTGEPRDLFRVSVNK